MIGLVAVLGWPVVGTVLLIVLDRIFR